MPALGRGRRACHRGRHTRKPVVVGNAAAPRPTAAARGAAARAAPVRLPAARPLVSLQVKVKVKAVVVAAKGAQRIVQEGVVVELRSSAVLDSHSLDSLQ